MKEGDILIFPDFGKAVVELRDGELRAYFIDSPRQCFYRKISDIDESSIEIVGGSNANSIGS